MATIVSVLISTVLEKLFGMGKDWWTRDRWWMYGYLIKREIGIEKENMWNTLDHATLCYSCVVLIKKKNKKKQCHVV